MFRYNALADDSKSTLDKMKIFCLRLSLLSIASSSLIVCLFKVRTNIFIRVILSSFALARQPSKKDCFVVRLLARLSASWLPLCIIIWSINNRYKWAFFSRIISFEINWTEWCLHYHRKPNTIQSFCLIFNSQQANGSFRLRQTVGTSVNIKIQLMFIWLCEMQNVSANKQKRKNEDEFHAIINIYYELMNLSSPDHHWKMELIIMSGISWRARASDWAYACVNTRFMEKNSSAAGKS